MLMGANKGWVLCKLHAVQLQPLLPVSKLSRVQRVKVSKHLVVAKLLAFLVLVLVLLPSRSLCVLHTDYIEAGFSDSAMSYVDSDGVFLQSISSNFAVALYAFTGKFAVYLNVIHTPSHTIVWTANRDSPASPSDMLEFLPSGNVVLMSGNGSSLLWSTKTRGATRMQIKETGNLVLLDALNNTVWQSFDYPTDTLLSGQVLRTAQGGMKLVSSISESNFSSGPFALSLESGDLQLLVSNLRTALPYWSMSSDLRLVTLTSGLPSFAIFNNTGLSLVRNDSALISLFSWQSTATLSRATLEMDGNLRVYVFSSDVWAPLFVALSSNCDLPLFCGNLGLCNDERCTCPGTLQPVNKNVITEGCRGPSKVPTCGNNSSTSTHFEKIADGLDYFANQYIHPERTSGLDKCKDLCSNKCNCSSLFFHNETGFCYLFDELGTIQTTSTSGHALYMKATNPSQGSNQGRAPSSQSKAENLPLFPILGIVGSSILVILVMIGIFTYWRLTRHPQVNRLGEHSLDDDESVTSMPGPMRFSFRELQIATNNFSKKLGSGGFGTVYEGLLCDQSKVAVKKLESMEQGRKEFRAEVAIIGSIHHVHLVHLRGFCADGVHKLLVYEFMSKGSLHRCLFESGEDNWMLLDWTTRHKIALGTARGLAYLHDDCRETILHCDIKPENILLDENFNAKVSDFGLAKLLNKEQSQVFTTMRGTRGYLAPEWLLNLPISDKSDVYSFGMVLLEIISGRKNYVPSETSEKCYLPAFAFAQAALGHLEELLDERLRGSVSNDKVIQSATIALWCIQEEISARPSVARVVQMLEGNIRVCDLSSSSLQSLRLHASMAEVLMASQKTSSVASNESSQSQALLSSVKISD